jgi:N-methylhydantoinase A
MMMKSDGGAASADMLSATPVQTVMSGPVAGVIGARFIGNEKGIENLITFDTGGTSSDMSVIPGGVLYKSDVSVARHPVRTRTVDIETIGAGGGSIASIELGGVLKVGPQSAGASPGPACYDRGGTQPTLTDALVILGYLNPDALLDGAMAISAAKARDAVRTNIGASLNMSDEQSAWGILRVLVMNCVVAMRTITVERGFDPREFALVAYGGMGPTIAGLIAKELAIARILVPTAPGTFSAWGMLVTDVHHDRTVTRVTRLDDTTPEAVEAMFHELETSAIDDLLREKLPRDHLTTRRVAGMRYRGQSYEVDVPVADINNEGDLAALADRFHEAHDRRYGHMAQNEAIEIVNYKVTGVGALPKPGLRKYPSSTRRDPPVATSRFAFFGEDVVEVNVYKRRDLRPGDEIAGPAVIDEQTSTVVIYPGQRAIVDEFLQLDIDVNGT